MDSVGDYHLSLASKQNANLYIDTSTYAYTYIYVYTSI